MGGSGRPPFWRTLQESCQCKGLGLVTLKINTQHTHLSRKEGLRGQPRPGVDSNVSDLVTL